jgi:hypothetical protein
MGGISMKIKKILAVLTALTSLISVSLASFAANAEDISDIVFPSDEYVKTTVFDINYEYEISDNTLFINGGTGKVWSQDDGTYPWDSERENIESVVIGSDITSIGKYAFADMPNLTSVSIDENAAIYFNYGAFKGDSSLKSITLNDNCSFNAFAFDIDSGITIYGYAGSSVQVGCMWYGYNFVSIGDSETSSISTDGYLYTDPDSTVTFDTDSRTLYIESNQDITPSEDGNYDASDDKIIGYQEVLNYIDYETGEVSYIQIPIHEDTSLFQGVTALKSFKAVINGDVKRIDSMFTSMVYLTEVELPDSLESIGEDTFLNTNLETVKLPENVKYIGDMAFGACRNLKSIYIPAGIEEIDGSAFYGCLKDNLTIYGYVGSVAEKYAIENGINFVDVTTTDEDFVNTRVLGDINSDGVFDTHDWLVNKYGVTNVENSDYYELFDKEDFANYMSAERIGDGVTITTADLSDEVTNPSETVDETTNVAVGETSEETKVKNSLVTYILGDANADGVLDVADVILVNKATVNAAALSDLQIKLADFNNDGVVDSLDALAILKKLVCAE